MPRAAEKPSIDNTSFKWFRRISLEPGEKKTVIFEPDDLAFFGMGHVVELGELEVLVGSSFADIRLRGVFRVEERI